MDVEKLTAKEQAALREYGLAGTPAGKQARRFVYRCKERLCTEDTPLEHLLVLTEGRCKVVFTLANGNHVLLGFYGAETMGTFGDLEFLSGTRVTSDVWAVSKAACLAIPLTQAVAEDLRGNLAFTRRVAEGLAMKFRLTSHNNSVRLLTSLEERLCSYIYMASDGDVFHENLTELAGLLATSYRHLMRTLRALCEAGVLRGGEGGVYYIVDKAYLAQRSTELSLPPIRPNIG